MLGKVSEATCRLNVYMFHSGQSTKSFSSDGWGYGQVTGRKCLVARDAGSRKVHVLGMIRRRETVPHEDLALMTRARVVEEAVTASGRFVYEFLLEDVDDDTKRRVLLGPIVEPNALVGDGIRL